MVCTIQKYSLVLLAFGGRCGSSSAPSTQVSKYLRGLCMKSLVGGRSLNSLRTITEYAICGTCTLDLQLNLFDPWVKQIVLMVQIFAPHFKMVLQSFPHDATRPSDHSCICDSWIGGGGEGGVAAVGCTHVLYGVFCSLQGSDFHCHEEENLLQGEKVRRGRGNGLIHV